MTKPLKGSSGFTMIELLVVISIIGLLSSVVLASVATTREKARDSRRLAEMNSMIKAIELYASSNNGLYPSLGTDDVAYNFNATLSSLLSPYIRPVPSDPIGSSWHTYQYVRGPSPYGFGMYVRLERNGGTYCKMGVGMRTTWWSSVPTCS